MESECCAWADWTVDMSAGNLMLEVRSTGTGIAREVPSITECYRITGEDCYFVKLYLRSIDDLEPVLDLFTPHGRTTTSIVHSAPVPPRPLPVPMG